MEECPCYEMAFRGRHELIDSVRHRMLHVFWGYWTAIVLRGKTPDLLRLSEAVENEEAILVFAMSVWSDVSLRIMG